MKEKIIIFLIGLFLGSIISTSAIYIYTIAENKNNNQNNMQMPDGGKGNPGEMNSNGEIGNPPEKPNDENISK